MKMLIMMMMVIISDDDDTNDDDYDKDGELVNLLRSKVRNPRTDLVLIFVARKNTCDFVTNMLNRVGMRAAAMHSDRDQKHREATLADFKVGHIYLIEAKKIL